MTAAGKIAGQATREQDLRSFLGTFNFGGDMVKQAVGSMSGGEKARLVLCMIVWQRPNLLLLDEPTNHLDLATREALAMALNEFEGTVMLVSHDRALLRASATSSGWSRGRRRTVRRRLWTTTSATCSTTRNASAKCGGNIEPPCQTHYRRCTARPGRDHGAIGCVANRDHLWLVRSGTCWRGCFTASARSSFRPNGNARSRSVFEGSGLFRASH
jgi:hypothetical protein